jgi:hypothetical protein
MTLILRHGIKSISAGGPVARQDVSGDWLYACDRLRNARARASPAPSRGNPQAGTCSRGAVLFQLAASDSRLPPRSRPRSPSFRLGPSNKAATVRKPRRRSMTAGTVPWILPRGDRGMWWLQPPLLIRAYSAGPPNHSHHDRSQSTAGLSRARSPSELASFGHYQLLKPLHFLSR